MATQILGADATNAERQTPLTLGNAEEARAKNKAAAPGKPSTVDLRYGNALRGRGKRAAEDEQGAPLSARLYNARRV